MQQNTLKHIEWQLLRRSLILCVSCLGVGLILLVISMEYKSEKEELKERLDIKLLELNSKNSKALRDNETYRQYLPMVNKYMERGYMGEEQRVLWIDILREITKDLKLPNMQYAITEQSDYEHKGSELPIGDFSVVNSEMEVSMSLFHERDLFSFINTLNDRAKGLFYVDKCSIQRTFFTGRKRLEDASLNVKCKLVWISVQYPQLATQSTVNNDES